MLTSCAPSQLTAQSTSGLISSSTTQPMCPALGMPHMIKLPTYLLIWPPALEFGLPLPRVLFCEPRQIPFVVETISLLLVVSAPVRLHIDFPLRLCSTVLVTDVILTHPFDCYHFFWSGSLGAAESLKNHLYRSDYLDQGIAFAPRAFNSFSRNGPEAICYQMVIAGKLAQRICPMPTFDLPDSAA
jgi:hypothetical protein